MKQKRLKTQRYDSEDTKEIRNLIIIAVILIALAVGLYFLTDTILSKKNKDTSTVEFDYTECTVGTMFNRPYDEYYVFLYDSTSSSASQYQSLISNYEKKDNNKKIYFVDLSTKFNSPYVSDKSNKKPTKASEVQVKDSALVLIKNGKVSTYYESVTDYEKVLN